MSVPKVRLYVRVALPVGKSPFLDPVYSGNQKLKEGYNKRRLHKVGYFEDLMSTNKEVG